MEKKDIDILKEMLVKAEIDYTEGQTRYKDKDLKCRDTDNIVVRGSAGYSKAYITIEFTTGGMMKRFKGQY